MGVPFLTLALHLTLASASPTELVSATSTDPAAAGARPGEDAPVATEDDGASDGVLWAETLLVGVHAASTPVVVTSAIAAGVGTYAVLSSLSTVGIRVPQIRGIWPAVIAPMLVPMPFALTAAVTAVVAFVANASLGGCRAAPAKAALYAPIGAVVGGIGGGAVALVPGLAAAALITYGTATNRADGSLRDDVSASMLVEQALSVVLLFGGPVFLVTAPVGTTIVASLAYAIAARDGGNEDEGNQE